MFDINITTVRASIWKKNKGKLMDPTTLFQKQLMYWDYYKHRVSHYNNNAVQYNVYNVPQMVAIAPVWDSL